MGLASGALCPPASIAAALVLVLGESAEVSDVTVHPHDPLMPWQGAILDDYNA